MKKVETLMAKKSLAHVLIFPFPGQGFINPMLKLAELLNQEGLHVTFLNTEYNHERLLRFTDIHTRFARLASFRFETIPDGLPLDHSRTLRNSDVLSNINKAVQPAFKELVFSGSLECDGRPPVSCIIADGLFTFTIDVAEELGIPSISFRTASACYFWACFCIPKLIEAGGIPFPDEADMDELINGVPGMEGLVRLRRRDLPGFCRVKDINDSGLQLVLKETQNSARASAHIFNTFDALDGPVISQIRLFFPKIYTLGPMHALLNSRCNESSPSSSSTSLLEVDISCMMWLDSQPLNSVIYVSFGSVIFMTQSEMLEFWHGLVNSGKRFLWVIRPDLVTDKDDTYKIPEELQEETKKRGYIVGWSPQEKVLSHPSVGGFLTHSGWNSTLESVVAGVPMICWPHYADQQTNSRFVSEAWKIGLDMKDMCERSTIEKMVRDLMDNRRHELLRSLNKMTNMAKKSVSYGGSSFNNLDKLIQDIKEMSLGT